MTEELTDHEVEELIKGKACAERGDDLPIGSSQAFIDGYALALMARVRKAQRNAQCTFH